MNATQKSSRGAQTRDSLLSAAIKVFGRDGFDAASTRAIAEVGGVNQALIGYHFGGKEGLYLAVFEHIADRMSLQMAPVAERVLAELPLIDPRSSQRVEMCVACIDQVFTAQLQLMGETPDARGWLRLVTREQQDPTRAFDILYARVISKMLGLLTAITAVATGLSEDSEACRLQALTIISQVMFVLVARSAATRYMGWAELGPDELQLVKRQALENILAQFHGVAGS